jgi:hypothetical protein
MLFNQRHLRRGSQTFRIVLVRSKTWIVSDEKWSVDLKRAKGVEGKVFVCFPPRKLCCSFMIFAQWPIHAMLLNHY